MPSDTTVLETRHDSGKASPAAGTHTTHKKPSKGDDKVSRAPHRKKPPASRRRVRQQAGKMLAIGQLAGGIAHDFNNLLTVILGHSEFLLRRDEPKEHARQRITEIRKAAQRGAWLTSQLLAYSRNQILEPAVLQINSVLEDMDGILRSVLGEDIALDLLMDANLGWTKVDGGQLQQIVLNLAANARDAMPTGGRLRLETFNVCIDSRIAGAKPFVPSGEYVALLVRDNGTGMDAETRERIFEPFFTTKEKGKGTGLGLATVYGIVKQSGGYIWAESEPGRGSMFHTLLPRVAPPSGSGAVQEALDFRAGGETVLLVEDDPAVRRTAAEILSCAGYEVLAAPSGTDALQAAAKQNGRVDLLLTDVVMPGMTGPELARQFRRQFAGIPILYMSGYTDDALEKHGVRGKVARVLQKPFTHESLARAVQEALGPFRRGSLSSSSSKSHGK
ncbi:MAG TPA: ATP-binding protein [Verrucomicrobiae bacterium]|nr:ATP-binding protein [Verrucomicrobiae bacterium]